MLPDAPEAPDAPLRKWDESRLLWGSKGFKIESIAAELAKAAETNPELKKLKLSVTSIQRSTLSDLDVPRPVAELVWGLKPVDDKARHLSEIVESGLRVMAGMPVEPRKVAPSTAATLLERFPTDAVALRLADALLKQINPKLDALQVTLNGTDAKVASAEAKTDTIGSKLDGHQVTLNRTEAKVASVDAKIDTIGPKLDTLQATLNRTDMKVDGLEARTQVSEGRRPKETREILRSVWISGAVVGAIAMIGFVVLFARTGTTHAADAASAPSVIVVANMASTPLAFDVQMLLGAMEEQMGEKVPPEQRIPERPLPGQKAPPCDARFGEVALGAGCWVNTGDVKPPCGLLFRSGEKCYRPVAADPQKPVGFTPEPLKREEQVPQ